MPRAQTCCGQPAYNSGDRADAKAIARQVIDAFAGLRLRRRAVGLLRRHDQACIIPSSSPTIRQRCARAKDLAARTYELVSFLADVLRLERVDARCDGVATYHDACSGLRELGVKAQPRRLLAAVEGLTLREIAGTPRSAAASAARSASNIRDISDKMVSDKAADIAATGADTLLAGDLGCLLNMAGKLVAARQPIASAPCRRGAGRHDRRRPPIGDATG